MKTSAHKKSFPLKTLLCALTTLTTLTALTAMTLCFSSAAEEDGSGVRGGGKVVWTEKGPRLLDRETLGVCQYQDADEVLKLHSVVIDRLRAKNWYMASVFERHAADLKICWTGPLQWINTIDHSRSPILPYEIYSPPLTQTGVRDGSDIYIDSLVFNQLPKEDQSWFLVHEIAHSFVPRGYDYYRRLYETTRALVAYGAGTMTRKDFEYTLQRSQFLIPATSNAIDPIRKDIETLLSPSALRLQKATSLQNAGGISVTTYLWSEDQKRVQTFAEDLADEFSQAETVSDDALMITLGKYRYTALSMLPFSSVDGTRSDLTFIERAMTRDQDQLLERLLKTLGLDSTATVAQSLWKKAGTGLIDQKFLFTAQKFGANLNADVDADGNTAFHYLAKRLNTPGIENLVTHLSADLNLKNKQGLSPFVIAAQAGNYTFTQWVAKRPTAQIEKEIRTLDRQKALALLYHTCSTYKAGPEATRIVAALLGFTFDRVDLFAAKQIAKQALNPEIEKIIQY